MKFTLVINEQMAHINHLLSKFFSDISIPLFMRTFGAGLAWPLFWEQWIYFFFINKYTINSNQTTYCSQWLIPFDCSLLHGGLLIQVCLRVNNYHSPETLDLKKVKLFKNTLWIINDWKIPSLGLSVWHVENFSTV